MPPPAAEIYKRKAAENYSAARQLVKTAPNAAATRAYYALYLALIGEFEQKGIRPESVDPIAKSAIGENEKLRWRHSVIRQNGALAGLSSLESFTVKYSYDIRIDADYTTKLVNSMELERKL